MEEVKLVKLNEKSREQAESRGLKLPCQDLQDADSRTVDLQLQVSTTAILGILTR